MYARHDISRSVAILAAATMLAFSGDLSAESIADIYEQALANDPQLRANLASLRGQREAAATAVSALLPQLSASGERINAYNKDTRRSGRVEERDTDQDRYGVTLNQNLFSLSTWFNFRRGDQLTRRADALLANEQQDLVLRVATAYFDVLRAGEDLISARAEEAAFSRQLGQVRNRFDTGLASATDVLEVQAAYDLAVADRLSREERVEDARETLSVITGRRPNELWRLREQIPVTPPEPADPEQWVLFALEGSYTLQAAALQEQAARFQSRARRGAHFPTLSGQLNYQRTDTKGDAANFGSNEFANEFFTEESRQDSAILRLELPLFTGGRLSSERRRAYQEYLQAREEHIRARRDLSQRVRSLHHSLRIAVAREEARRRALQSTESALRSIRAGYESGTRDIVDVLNAERNVYRSRRDYSHSRLDYLLDTLQMKALVGQLGPDDVAQINQRLEPPSTSLRERQETGASPLPARGPRSAAPLPSQPASPVTRHDEPAPRGHVTAQTLQKYPASAFTLQLAALKKKENVRQLLAEYSQLALFYIAGRDADGEPLFRVCTGVFESLPAARMARENLPPKLREQAWPRVLSDLSK